MARDDAAPKSLLALAKSYGVNLGDQNTSAEDLRDRVDGDDDIGAWVAVTVSESTGIHYFYDRVTEAEAKEACLQYAGDPTWHETPVEVRNLETGVSTVPTATWSWS